MSGLARAAVAGDERALDLFSTWRPKVGPGQREEGALDLFSTWRPMVGVKGKRGPWTYTQPGDPRQRLEGRGDPRPILNLETQGRGQKEEGLWTYSRLGDPRQGLEGRGGSGPILDLETQGRGQRVEGALNFLLTYPTFRRKNSIM